MTVEQRNPHTGPVVAEATAPLVADLGTRALEKYLAHGPTACSLTELRAIPRRRLSTASRRRLADAIDHRERSTK